MPLNITGTSEPDSNIVLYLGHVNLNSDTIINIITTTTSDINGNFTLQLNDLQANVNSNLSITAKETGKLTSNPIKFTMKYYPPPIDPTISTSNTTFYTKRPIIEGNTSPGATVRIYKGTEVYAETTASSSSDGKFSFTRPNEWGDGETWNKDLDSGQNILTIAAFTSNNTRSINDKQLIINIIVPPVADDVSLNISKEWPDGQTFLVLRMNPRSGSVKTPR